MKKKISALILTFILAASVYSCGDTTTESSSAPSSENESAFVSETSSSENNSSDISENTNDVGLETSEESSVNKNINQKPDIAKGEAFDIVTTGGTYSFGNFTGRYDTEFTGVENPEGGITLTLLDGREMLFKYSEIVYDEENDIYRTQINGMDFWVHEKYRDDGQLVQNFECIQRPEIFEGTDIITNIIITYYPQYGKGNLGIAFVYEIDGENMILKYADGGVLNKKIAWNESQQTYEFVQ